MNYGQLCPLVLVTDKLAEYVKCVSWYRLEISPISKLCQLVRLNIFPISKLCQLVQVRDISDK